MDNIDKGELVDSRLYNLRAIKDLTSLSTATIYRLLDQNRIPRPKKIGRSVRWLGSEIREWIESLKTT